MTLTERLAELRLHLNHLREIRPEVRGPESLMKDLSLRNDVFHSLQTVCQVVIDVSGELCARAGLPFQDYTEAVRNLARIGPFPISLVKELEPLPGFRNVLIHEYAGIDPARVIEALDRLEPIEAFGRLLAAQLADESADEGEPRG